MIKKVATTRKGAAMWIRVTIGLVLLIIVLIVVSGALGAFIRSLAASPEDQAKQSQIVLARAISDVIKEGEGIILKPTCEKIDMHLTRGYYLTVNSTKLGPGGEFILEAVEDASGGPKTVRDKYINGTAPLRRICCHSKFDDEGLCNTHCGGGETMIIGKNEDIHESGVCVCLYDNEVTIFVPDWYTFSSCKELW